MFPIRKIEVADEENWTPEIREANRAAVYALSTLPPHQPRIFVNDLTQRCEACRNAYADVVYLPCGHISTFNCAMRLCNLSGMCVVCATNVDIGSYVYGLGHIEPKCDKCEAIVLERYRVYTAFANNSEGYVRRLHYFNCMFRRLAAGFANSSIRAADYHVSYPLVEFRDDVMAYLQKSRSERQLELAKASLECSMEPASEPASDESV